MILLMYLVIIVLFVVLISWTWNNVKSYNTISQKIAYIIIGFIVVTIITLILFNISKANVKYPNIEIMEQVRKTALLVFIPINGLLSLPHFASIFQELSSGTNDEKTKRKLIILSIIIIVAIIIETSYLKNFQNGIIKILNSK